MMTDTLMAYDFAVEIDGIVVGLAEVSGLESRIEVEELAEGGVNGHAHKLPGRVSHSNLVLRRGVATNSFLRDWYEQVLSGDFCRRSGAVILWAGVQSQVWTFHQALPVSWTGPQFDALAGQVAFESIELVHHGLTRHGGLGIGM